MSNKSPPRARPSAVDTSKDQNRMLRPGSPSNARNIGSSSGNRFDKVKKNAKGGVHISVEEIQAAFAMLDVDNTKQITLPNLKKRLGVLFPDMSAKDYRFLMNNKKELLIDDLKELLVENEITNFDPVYEAFRVFDTRGEGKLDGEKLRHAFIAYGFGELSDEELEILIRTADVDGDGIISLEDFRTMADPTARPAHAKSFIHHNNHHGHGAGHHNTGHGHQHN